jgi:ABC-2 type transport system permease protein
VTTVPMSSVLAASDRGTWRAAVRKYVAILNINVRNSLAYVWDALGSGVFVVIFVFIFSQLWRATFRAQGASVIGGLTLNQTIWYFVWAELIQLSKIQAAQTIQTEVQEGSLAYTLGRPYHYLIYHFAFGLGGVFIRIAFVLVFGSAVALIQVGPLRTFRPEVMPGVLLVTALSFTLDYCITAVIGLTAFFVEDTSAFRLIYSKTNFVLGGLLLPVDFLPGSLQSVARLLPFNLVLYAPSKLFVAWDSAQFGDIIVLQIVWLAAIGTGLMLMFRWGVRRVSINGG